MDETPVDNPEQPTKKPKKPKKANSTQLRAWWDKHKNKLYIVAAILGAIGVSNADRLDIVYILESALTVPERLDNLEERVKILEEKTK
jgi:hypothetical protein